MPILVVVTMFTLWCFGYMHSGGSVRSVPLCAFEIPIACTNFAGPEHKSISFCLFRCFCIKDMPHTGSSALINTASPMPQELVTALKQ